MREQVKCTKDCWLYDRAESCMVRKRKPNGTYFMVHREYCDSPRPGDGRDKGWQEERLNNFVSSMEDNEDTPRPVRQIPKQSNNMKCMLVGKKRVPQAPKKAKAVLRLDKFTGNILHQYASVDDAARALGKTTTGSIYRACRGEIKTAYGYKWKFVSTKKITK